jgi:hypothetical protein
LFTIGFAGSRLHLGWRESTTISSWDVAFFSPAHRDIEPLTGSKKNSHDIAFFDCKFPPFTIWERLEIEQHLCN